MNRTEFIEECSKLSRSELVEIALQSRINVWKRVPEELKPLFRSLDDQTEVEERYFETSWGQTHVSVGECPWRRLDSGTFGARPVFLPPDGASGGMCSF